MLDELSAAESNPPAYQLLAWLWEKPFGHGEVGLRSLSALIGTATVPAAWWASAGVLGDRARVALAALVAVNPLLVWYSQEARAYALVVLLTTLSLGFFARALQGRGGRPLLWWAVTASLALATHYFAAFLVFPMAAWLAWRRRALAAAAAPVATAALLLPLALEQRANGGASGVGDPPLLDRLEDVPRKFLVGEFGGPVRGLAPLAALLCLAAVGLLAWRGGQEERRRAALPLAAGAAVVAVPFVLGALGFDYFTTRYVLIAWIPLLAAVAAGVAVGRAGTVAVAAVAAVFLLCSIAVPLTPRLQRDDWRGAAAALGEPAGPRAVVVSPDVGFVPLGVYEPEIEAPPGEAFATSEVAYVVMTREDEKPLPLPAQIRPDSREDDATYLVARYGAPRGRAGVTTDALAAIPLAGGESAVLYERGP
jgi:mannosyltransferase